MSNRTWFAQQQWGQWEVGAMRQPDEYNSPLWESIRKRLAELEKVHARLFHGDGDDTLILSGEDEPEDQAKAHGQEIVPDPADVDDFEVLHPEDAD